MIKACAGAGLSFCPRPRGTAQRRGRHCPASTQHQPPDPVETSCAGCAGSCRVTPQCPPGSPLSKGSPWAGIHHGQPGIAPAVPAPGRGDGARRGNSPAQSQGKTQKRLRNELHKVIQDLRLENLSQLPLSKRCLSPKSLHNRSF